MKWVLECAAEKSWLQSLAKGSIEPPTSISRSNLTVFLRLRCQMKSRSPAFLAVALIVFSRSSSSSRPDAAQLPQLFERQLIWRTSSVRSLR